MEKESGAFLKKSAQKTSGKLEHGRFHQHGPGDKEREQLRQLLLEGAASPPSGTADERYFDSLRERVRNRKAG